MIAFYRALLHLYPAGFRAEYGQELCAIFSQRILEDSGPLAPLRLIFAAILDVVPNAIAAHFDILRVDIRYAARALRAAPGFALTAILVVALGVGANTAAFSLADFVLLRPLPFPESDRLVKLWQATESYGQNEVSPANYRDWKSMATSFRDMGAHTGRAMNLVGEGTPRRLQAARVTPELLPMIGVQPLMGRFIKPGDGGEDAIAVLSYDLWHSQFAGDQDVIGRVVRLDGAPHTVVGVMPPDFHFPSREAEIWTPLVFQGEDFTDRNDTYIEVVARLAPGVTFESARAEMVNVTARLEQQYPEENRDVGIYMHRLRDQVSRGSRLLVVALCGASLCILLLSCANLAGIMLARGFSRTRELAVRTALGAGRERLIRQLMTESVFLAVCGGLLGVGVAVAGLPLLSRLVPNALPVAQVPTVDLRVMIFAAGLIGLTGLGFGVAPALRAANRGALEALRERAETAGRSRQRLRSALVVLEVTGSIVLLVTSGLLMRAIWRMQAVDPGFRTEGVMTLRTALPLPKYQATAARVQFYERVLEQVRALPGVQSAAYATGLPIERRGGIWPVVPGGGNVERTDTNSASLRYITPQFFSTLGIPLRSGRDFSQSDVTGSPYVAVVSESLARREWPNQDPMGRKFGFAQSDRTVIGVVGEVRVRGLEFDSEPQVYVPASQVADNSIIGYIPQDLIIRSSQSMEQLLPSVRRIIAAADPEQPISHVRPLSEVVADSMADRRVQIRLLLILSAIALLIAGVGIHGLLSFAVTQRTQELGIRRALGAQAGEIVAMVVREGLRLVLAGAVAGIIFAVMVGRGMNALLFGVAPNDLQTIVSAVALCLVTALLGCLRPALQAARVDPMIALRS